MGKNVKPSGANLKKVDDLLALGKTLEEIEKEKPRLAAAVRYRRTHERARPGGAAPEPRRPHVDPLSI